MVIVMEPEVRETTTQVFLWPLSTCLHSFVCTPTHKLTPILNEDAHTYTYSWADKRLQWQLPCTSFKGMQNVQIIDTQTQAFMTGEESLQLSPWESYFKKIGLKPKLPWRPQKVEISNMGRATASWGERLFRIEMRKWVDLLKLFWAHLKSPRNVRLFIKMSFPVPVALILSPIVLHIRLPLLSASVLLQVSRVGRSDEEGEILGTESQHWGWDSLGTENQSSIQPIIKQ